MKKILSVFMFGAATIAYAAPANNGYEVNGTFADASSDNEKLFLMVGENAIDSTVVKGSTFTFKGATDDVMVCRLAKRVTSRGQVRFAPVAKLLLNADTKVNVTIGQTVTLDDNGGANSICSNFMQEYTDFNNTEVQKYQDLIAQKAPEDSVQSFINGVRTQMSAMWQKAVDQNKDNLAGASIFSDFCYEVQDAAAFDSIYASLKYADAFAALQAQKKVFENLAATAEGKMFADFGGKDMEGKDIKLSDYVGKGKYVLVDFWASWCGPCRREIPNILNVNKLYNGDKFMVLGVDVWDKEVDFKKAVEKEKINYPQIFTMTKDATELYGINGIPHIILFAPDGTIVKRGLRGAAIESVVKENLNK